MSGWMDSKLFTLLEGGLDGLGLRHRVLVDNIANNDTPNFKRSDVDFEKLLQAGMNKKDPGQIELKRTLPSHLPGVPLSSGQFVVQDKSTSFRNDGNNVDIDLEMTRLAQNTLHYNALSRSLTSHLTQLRQVIQDK